MRLRVRVNVPTDPAHGFERERYRDLLRLGAVDFVKSDRWVSRLTGDEGGPREILARERWRVTRTRGGPARQRHADLVFAYGPLPLWVPHGDRLVWHHGFRRPSGMDASDWRALESRRYGHAARRAERVVVPHADDLACFGELFPFARDKAEVLPYYLPELEPLSDEALSTRTAAPGPLRVVDHTVESLDDAHVLVLGAGRDPVLRARAQARGVVVVEGVAEVDALGDDRGLLAERAQASLAAFRRDAWHTVVGPRYLALFQRVAAA